MPSPVHPVDKARFALGALVSSFLCALSVQRIGRRIGQHWEAVRRRPHGAGIEVDTIFAPCDHFCRRRGMRQSLWRRAWRRLLVCTVEGGCFLNRERRDMCVYAILGECLCAPRMFLVVSADQGAEAVRMVVDRKTCAPALVISLIRPISTVRTRSGHRRN